MAPPVIESDDARTPPRAPMQPADETEQLPTLELRDDCDAVEAEVDDDDDDECEEVARAAAAAETDGEKRLRRGLQRDCATEAARAASGSPSSGCPCRSLPGAASAATGRRWRRGAGLACSAPCGARPNRGWRARGGARRSAGSRQVATAAPAA